MKYAAALLTLAAGALALPQDASSITSAPVASASLTPQVSCALSCSTGDVTCQAACYGVARPNSSQAVESNECAAKCDQGDGSPEATEAYAKCQQDCFASFYPSSQTIAPFAPGAASSAAASAGSSATGSAGSAASTGASASGTGAQASDSPSGSATGSAAEASGTGAAGSNSAQIVGAGLAGLMAIFAL